MFNHVCSLGRFLLAQGRPTYMLRAKGVWRTDAKKNDHSASLGTFGGFADREQTDYCNDVSNHRGRPHPLTTERSEVDGCDFSDWSNFWKKSRE